ncbi:hypothetical protein AB0C11_00440 [Streptomyces sp. NPDC039016]|uniref:hypothetical protein n=1 Tax=Streptomyces sp. NPDC039016 TaxID=3154330 RepID=UPI0033F45C0A
MRDHADRTPRLLPWTTPEGNPCFLLPSDGTGYVSRLADRLESEQLGSAAVLIEDAERILADRSWTPGELHLLTVELKNSLVTTHRVAESRGARLPVPAYEPDEDPDDDPEDYPEDAPDDGPRRP